MNDDDIILDFDKALNLIDSVSESFKVDVWIPSIKKTISFREIEAKQQKALLSSAMEKTIYNSSFSKIFKEIINKNLIETEDFKKEDLNNLNIFDKANIAINLKNRISNKTKVIFDANDNISEIVELTDVIEKLNNLEYSDEETVEMTNGNLVVKAILKLPTISQEVTYDDELSKLFKKTNDIKTEDDVKTIVTEAFISESSKYIDKIFVSDQEINFQSLTLKQKIQITERLSSTIIQKILEAVSNWKTIIDNSLEVKFKEYTSVIKIDSVLFLN